MTGFSSFKVEVADGQDPITTGSPTWRDITALVKNISVTRGRKHFLEMFPAGTAQVTVDNSNGAFDSLGFDLNPMCPVRISTVDSFGSRRNLFAGFTSPEFDQTTWKFAPPSFGEVTFQCSDMLAWLAGRQLPELDQPAYDGLLAGTAITAIILTYAPLVPAWTSPTINAGRTIMQGVTLGTDALQLFQKYALSEGGCLYVDRDGSLFFEDRMDIWIDNLKSLTQVTFSDVSGAAMAAENFTMGFTPCYTSASVQRQGADVAETYSEDSANIGDRTFPAITGALMSSSAESASLAQRIVKQTNNPWFYPHSLRVKPRRNAASLDAAVQRELRDLVTCHFNSQDYLLQVEGISHTVDFQSGEWDCDLFFSSRDGMTFHYDFDAPAWFTLDDATDGLLDGSRRLVW